MRPNIYFSQSINERSWQVWRPIVKLGEHQRQYFFYVDSNDAGQRELVTPPAGLYGKEFLELDHRDVFQLMEFQQRWGPITGLRTRPNVTFTRGTSADASMNGSFYKSGHNPIFHPDGIRKTEFLYSGYGEADIIARERFGTPDTTLKAVIRENMQQRHWGVSGTHVVPCHVASVSEVAEAVCDAQVAILAITNALREGYSDEDWKNDKELVRESVRYCNAVLTGSVTPVDLVEDGDRTGICTLMQYIFIGLARGIMLNNTYRNCQNPTCRRLFTPKEFGRRADARYCSEECQVRAKYQRSFRMGITHKTKETKGGGSESLTPHCMELELSWTTSGLPVKRVRKEWTKLAEEKDRVLVNGIQGLAVAYSFAGLFQRFPDEIPHTERLLDKLKGDLETGEGRG